MSARLVDVVEEHARRLIDAGVPAGANDAVLLAQHVLGLSRFQLQTGTSEDARALATLAALIDRRAAREPLQHLTGEVGFRYLTLRVQPGVFIPRPETEVLAGLALEHLRSLDHRAIVVEPCTGTGAVALALASEIDHADITAIDLSPDAVALARTNLAHVRAGNAGVEGLGTDVEVVILEGDLLDPVDEGLRGRLDLLVSNPPYLSEDELAACEPEVVDYDPPLALVGGPEGHEVVDRIIALGMTWLAPGGVLLLELSENRTDAAFDQAHAAGYTDILLRQDLTGRQRILRARRPRVKGAS